MVIPSLPLLLSLALFLNVCLSEQCSDTAIDCRGCEGSLTYFSSLTYDEANKYIYATGKTDCITGKIFDMKPNSLEPTRSMLIKYDEYLSPIWFKSIEGFNLDPLYTMYPVESLHYCALSIES